MKMQEQEALRPEPKEEKPQHRGGLVSDDRSKDFGQEQFDGMVESPQSSDAEAEEEPPRPQR